jgi:hypothetical protein
LFQRAIIQSRETNPDVIAEHRARCRHGRLPVTFMLDYSSTPYEVKRTDVMGSVTLEAADPNHKPTLHLPASFKQQGGSPTYVRRRPPVGTGSRDRGRTWQWRLVVHARHGRPRNGAGMTSSSSPGSSSVRRPRLSEV